MSRLSEARHPAYHLRPNKAIDRSIFIDILKILESYQSLNEHKYIGMGGPYLEDFRLLAKEFSNMQMLSVERDEQVCRRQSFHKCTSKMSIHNCEFDDFLSSDYPTDCPTITWVDYTDFDRNHLLEISDISRKAIPLSIIRVTVNAETPLYKKLGIQYPRRPINVPQNKQKEFKLFVAKFREKVTIDDVALDDKLFEWSMFTEDAYPNLLLSIISTIISSACTKPKCYVPIHSVKYSDGTIMLSITGAICKQEEKEKLIEHYKSRFHFFSTDIQNAEIIDVPFLTTKERMHLESLIPVSENNGIDTSNHLTYLIEGDESDSLSMRKMSQYEKYHRLYPYFGKLVP